MSRRAFLRRSTLTSPARRCYTCTGGGRKVAVAPRTPMAAETATETRRPVKRAIHLMMENHDAASTIYGRFPGAKTGMKTAQDDSLGVSGWVLERSSDTWTWRTADGEPPFRDTSDRPALCV